MQLFTRPALEAGRYGWPTSSSLLPVPVYFVGVVVSNLMKLELEPSPLTLTLKT